MNIRISSYGAVFGWVCDPFAMSAGENAGTLFDSDYTRMGTVEDPQGGILTLGKNRPPQSGSSAR